jgi:chromosome segregation ATPase
LGAEEYELLVSTLNKLPILKEKLTSERKKLELASRMVFSQKVEIDEVKIDLKTKDEEIGKINSKIKEINQKLEELAPVIADLDDNIKIEKEKVRPYTQSLAKKKDRLVRKKKRAKKRAKKDDSDISERQVQLILVFICFVFPLVVFLSVKGQRWFGYGDEMGNFLCCGSFLVLSVPFFTLFNGDSYSLKRATRKIYLVESEWNKARETLTGFEMKRGRNNNEKTKLVLEKNKLKSEKGRLKGLEKKLKEMNQKLDGLEDSASACSEVVESLVKEIEDGQNAIAPLIPYSDLLLGD